MYVVKTCDGYDEHWSCEGLRISYYGEREYRLTFDGVWQISPDCGENERDFLISSALCAEAVQKCLEARLAPHMVYEFLPEDKAQLIPSELLRILLDDCGLGIKAACSVIVRCFGELLCDYVNRDWLYSVQPRTAHLESVLQNELSASGHAVHKPYDAAYRYPLGAVKEGDRLCLSIRSFGGVKEALLELYGSADRISIPMRKEGDRFICELSPQTPEALRYRFRLYTESGEKWLISDKNGAHSILSDKCGDGFRLTVYRRDFETPEWFSRSVMYQVFPDRFGFEDDGTAGQGLAYHRALGQTPELHNSISEPVRWQPRDFENDYSPDDFYGGSFRGITNKLPYLKSLGVGVIYLNPVSEARSNHRYDTSDYSQPDPILGSIEDYVNLCSESKRLGISIINDGVFSHTGADSIYFNRCGSYGAGGAYRDRQSPYFPWYDFRSYPDDYRSWWGFRDLPEVNELDPSWQDYIVTGDNSIVRTWLKFGADGWRIDVADELPDEVLSLIRSAAKSTKPDCVIIGEVWEDALEKESYGKKRNYALGYSLDSVMNYPFRTAVLDFARGKTSAFDLRDFLLLQKCVYPQPMYRSLMNLLGSHDVERLHTALEFDFDIKSLDRSAQYTLSPTDEQYRRATVLQKLCAAIQYCVPGVPCLYYGDEECLDGGCDPFNRAPFEPSKSGLYEHYRLLGELRNTENALTDGDMRVSAHGADVLMIERYTDEYGIICVINRSCTPYSLPFSPKAVLLGTDEDLTVSPLSAGIYRI